MDQYDAETTLEELTRVKEEYETLKENFNSKIKESENRRVKLAEFTDAVARKSN